MVAVVLMAYGIGLALGEAVREMVLGGSESFFVLLRLYGHSRIVGRFFQVVEGGLIDGLSSIENPCLRSGLSRMVVPSICLRFVRLPGAWEAVEKGAPSAPPFLRNT